MKILVACEESQAVTIELRKLGHEAYSCDIIECSGGHPEWHTQGDALELINGSGDNFGQIYFGTGDNKSHLLPRKWDMIIAFPPCTHLAVSGAAHFEKKRADGRQREAVEFFCHFLNADCDRIAIENPVGIISGNYIQRWFPDLADKYGLPKKPTQKIQPWQFALTEEEKTKKTTCLWLKGLHPLVPQIEEQPEISYHEWSGPNKKRKRQTLWFYKTRCLPYSKRGTAASKTFSGIAKAMAEQWAGNA